MGYPASISPKRQPAFHDPKHLISIDEGHSGEETRLFCIGRTVRGILMVRFPYRGNTIRIIRAGYWRKGRRLYGKENPIESETHRRQR